MSITRRTFLGGLGGAAAACTGVPAAPPPSTGSTPVAPDWTALRARLDGRLILPGEAGYDAARRSFNTVFDTRAPAAVATCTRTEDVQACVEAARSARIPIAARSGGHSYAGYSTPAGGLVADLAGLSGVRVSDDGTAEIGPGARLIDLYAELARAGRCLPAGTCPTVGIAGLTLGGGIGVVARKFGLTCDRLTSARVVTADAALHTASGASEPDLFWALRGGGGGNFGIVTSFTFQTDPAPDLTVFAAAFPAGAAPSVLGAWQDWIVAGPDELWSNLTITAGHPPDARVAGCYVGSPAALNPLLDNLIRMTSARPQSRSVRGMGFLDAMRYFAGCTEHTVPECRTELSGGQLARHAFVASSRMLPAPVADPADLVSILDGRTGMTVMLDSWRGTISRIPPDATAFPHRTAFASAQIYSATLSATQPVAEVRDALGELTGPAAYLNYIDPTMPNWPTAYYGPNLPRLRTIATHYDPDAVFAFPQGVTRT